MNRYMRLLLGTAVLTLCTLGQNAYAACSTADFLAGPSPGIEANDCFTSDAKNNQMESVINSVWGPGFTQLSKYENGEGSEFGSLTVSDGDGSFNWSVDASAFDGVDDAVFVVKQANANGNNNDGISWAAYLFNSISETFGSFKTLLSFNVDDYSHVSVYGNESHAVPEIDTASTGIVLGLLLGMIALIRERRRVY